MLDNNLINATATVNSLHTAIEGTGTRTVGTRTSTRNIHISGTRRTAHILMDGVIMPLGRRLGTAEGSLRTGGHRVTQLHGTVSATGDYHRRSSYPILNKLHGRRRRRSNKRSASKGNGHERHRQGPANKANSNKSANRYNRTSSDNKRPPWTAQEHNMSQRRQSNRPSNES